MFELINKYYDENDNLEKINRSLVLSNEYSYSGKEDCYLWRLRTCNVNNDLFYYIKNEEYKQTIQNKIKDDCIHYVEAIHNLEQKENSTIKRYVLKSVLIHYIGGSYICLEI